MGNHIERLQRRLDDELPDGSCAKLYSFVDSEVTVRVKRYRRCELDIEELEDLVDWILCDEGYYMT